MRRLPARPVRVAVACLVSALLVPVAVLPQLSARLVGEELLLAVEPVDPIDPFRGAYVVLSYPGLREPDDSVPRGTVFVPLRREPGELVWTGGEPAVQRPASGPYLRCEADWRLRCGIESLFASQDRALRLERGLADGAVARVRVDGRGNAAVVGLVA